MTVAYFMFFDIVFHPLSFRATNIGHTKLHGMDYK